ncbi:SURF1 family protein [Corticibacter populi]|uniref:SURF1-like protein n=1 Tax=Corticibacter populi TaxID=1550736 RepID=A0A3M6QY61_9BURK|nr:SURF1 family protein [Corticibacter populi]RMX07861.1 SURF1 family protein [Corticibacter populi]RZS35097.1 surfeit locus 1 family protein [Corticibacter populi]
MIDALQPRARSWRRGALFFLLLATLAALLTLGTWQVQRLAWKKDLIARTEARVHAAPTAPPTAQAWAAEAEPGRRFEYQRVQAEGRWLHDKEVQVYASSVLGPGYWVMTPLRTAQGTIWINRGYVPNAQRLPASRAQALPEGSVTVTGLLRLPEDGGLFVRENVPAEERWYHRDLAAMNAARQLGDALPYFIDAGASPNPGGWPRGGLTIVQFRNNHLSYALTWYALALLNVLALVLVARSESRGARPRHDEED